MTNTMPQHSSSHRGDRIVGGWDLSGTSGTITELCRAADIFGRVVLGGFYGARNRDARWVPARAERAFSSAAPSTRCNRRPAAAMPATANADSSGSNVSTTTDRFAIMLPTMPATWRPSQAGRLAKIHVGEKDFVLVPVGAAVQMLRIAPRQIKSVQREAPQIKAAHAFVIHHRVHRDRQPITGTARRESPNRSVSGGRFHAPRASR